MAAAAAIWRLGAGAFLAILIALAPAGAETRSWWLGGVITAGATTAEPPPAESAPPAATAPDFDAWAAFAVIAEERIDDLSTDSGTLEGLRGQLAGWRERFLAAQTANAPRIDTLREQIAALGPAPGAEATEPEELATRRKELNDQLARAQAPGIAAEEAYRRADGLIREADRILRTRSAHKLLRHDPAPANPANWPVGIGALSAFTVAFWNEAVRAAADPVRRQAAIETAPIIVLALGLALLLLWRGRRWGESAARRFRDRLPPGWWGLVELPLSLGQVLLPIGLLMIVRTALLRAEFLGPLAEQIVHEGLVPAGTLTAVTIWVGGLVFPLHDRPALQLLRLTPERRIEGRLHVSLLAVAIGMESLLTSAFTVAAYGPGVRIVTFPVTILAGVLLFRLGQLLLRATTTAGDGDEAAGLRPVLMDLLGKAAIAIGICGPAIGAVGYIELADALVRPAVATLGMLAMLGLLQHLVYDVYGLITRTDTARAREALAPVLITFALGVSALPLLALIWGMRSTELLEYWARFREGFRWGDTRISPTDFLLFAVVFGIGYGLTKLLQGALRSTILPRTRIDTGGRNAIIAGTGYVGIVVAALAAITSTGLDLSSLAIVAGALSVGIGFGLQNIVSNFVSGIILLIERPIAEGDWIEVGGLHGTVRRISVRSTRVETFDRFSVIVPNADLVSGRVTNYTGFNMAGRLIVPVAVSYEADSRHVETILREIAEAHPMAVINPPPQVLLMGYTNGVLNFEIRVILRNVNFIMSVRSDLNHEIVRRFNEEGINKLASPRTYIQLTQPPAGADVPPPQSNPIDDLP